MIKETFGSVKPIIAMVHFPPLPGSPLYDAKRGMNWIIESAAKDIAALQKGGVDAVMACFVSIRQLCGERWPALLTAV